MTLMRAALIAGSLASVVYLGEHAVTKHKTVPPLQVGASSTIPVTDPTGGTGIRLTIQGNKLYDQAGKQVLLQGFNWSTYRDMGAQTFPEDPATIKAMGANTVRVPVRWYWGDEEPGASEQEFRDDNSPGHLKPEMLALLDQHIKWAVDQKLWVVLFIGSDPDWSDKDLLKKYTEVWEFLAERYKNTPYIAAYEILSEPHPKDPYTEEDVKNFYRMNIEAIRKHDVRTPIMIGSGKAKGCLNGTYDVRCLDTVYLENTPNMMYTFNFYEPPQYVKTDKQTEGGKAYDPYPGSFIDKKTGSKVTLDKNYLASLIKYAVDFSNTRNVPVFVNQIGVPMITPGSSQYTTDSLELLTKNGIGFTWWLYRQPDDKHSLHEGGRAAYWEDSQKVWHPNEKLIGLLSQFFGKLPQDIK